MTLQADAFWDKVYERDANSWCDDLCVSIMKSSYKEMDMIGLKSNQSWSCVPNMDVPRKCTAAELKAKEDHINKDEAAEAAFCAQVCSHLPK